MTTEYLDRKLRHIELGTCLSCGCDPPLATSINCTRCQKSVNQANRAKRAAVKAEGLCRVCRKAKLTNGHAACSACLESQRVKPVAPAVGYVGAFPIAKAKHIRTGRLPKV